MINSFSGNYHFLSNFYPIKIEWEGIEYPSTEHAYQAGKTFEQEFRVRISTLATPGLAKKAGKIVPLRPDWETVKYKVMYEVCSIKFKDPTLRQKLLDTSPHDLIEGNNWHDNVWGVCTCRKCPGEGRNLLGRALMEIRNDIVLTNLLHENRSK